MNEMQVFTNPEFGEIRTLEIKGEPWLFGKDVASALGYSNPSKAVISPLRCCPYQIPKMGIW